MSIKFSCCFCGHKLQAAAALASRSAKCPHCAKTVDVPAAESNPLTPLPGVANGEADQQPHVPALPVAAPGDTKPPGGPTVLPLKGFRKDKVFWFGLGGVVVSGTVLLMVLTSLKGTNNTDRPMSVAADTATARRPEGVAVAPSPPVSASTSPPVPVSALSPVHETLQEGLRVTGTVAREPEIELVRADRQWTGQRWNIRLQLCNETSLSLELGKDFLLYETAANDADIKGVALFRGHDWDTQAPPHLMPLAVAETFGLAENYLLFGEKGGIEHVRGSRKRIDNVELHPDGDGTVFDQPPSFSENPAEQPTRSFGALGAKQQRAVHLRLGLGRWLPEEALKHVVVVLPEIGVSEEKACFRLLVHFRRSAHAPLSAAGEWVPDRFQLIPVDPESMKHLLEHPGTDLVTRLCLANWLMKADPERGKQTLCRLAQSLHEGHLLATCLELLSQTKSPGLEQHAQQLLNTNSTPSFIRTWCAVYLGVRKYEPAFKALVAALDDDDPVVAEGAVHGLGAYGGPEGARLLLQRLRKAEPSHEAAVLADNVVFTKDRSLQTLKGLIELADADNLDVLQALARFGPPEFFDAFAAGALRHRQWPGIVAQVLWKTGGEKAVPTLLQMLEKSPPPPTDAPLEQNDLVEALILDLPALECAAFVAGAVRLAEAGNLSATQVLAELNDETARRTLVRLAGSGTTAQCEIALDGLARNWAGDGLDTLRDILKSAQPHSICVVLRALERCHNPAARDLVSPYLTHTAEEVRAVATDTLRTLPK